MIIEITQLPVAVSDRLAARVENTEVQHDARRIDAFVHSHMFELRTTKTLEITGQIDVGDLDLQVQRLGQLPRRSIDDVTLKLQ